jgi:tRNA (cmo5U34)-methyltransferase
MALKDTLFASPIERSTDFNFGEQTAQVFDDMLSRSVPFYDEVQRMIVEIIVNVVGERPLIYDLGCSTGTTLLLLATRLQNKNPRLVGVDSSMPMLERAQQRFDQTERSTMVIWEQRDLNDGLITDPADVFIMNLTLQFIRPLYREQLVANLYHNLKPGGCFILVEKVTADNPLLNRAYIELYYEFKRRNGYSELEIAGKREALENVLIPYRVNEDLELLNRCGFINPDTFFRWYNFAGFIGIKQRAAESRRS